MAVGDEHIGHLAGRDAGPGEAGHQHAADLRPEPGIDQHDVPRHLDQQRIDPERDGVGRRAGGGQHRGHVARRLADAEHRSVVGHQIAFVAERDERERAEAERRRRRSGRLRRGGGRRDRQESERGAGEHGE